MTTPEQQDQLNAFLCATCGHRANRHVSLNPEDDDCLECWDQVETIGQALTICHRFVLTQQDLATADNLLAAMELDIAHGSYP